MNVFKPKTTTTTTSTTTRMAAFPNKFAACFGINDYPGTKNDLNGCVNDARNWQDVLANIYGFNTQIFTDNLCTIRNFKGVLSNFVSNSKADDKFVITYSGHGTTVLDNAFGKDEPDGKDEAICLYDGNLVDDEIRSILSNLNAGSSLIFISDSCHSGSVTRSFLSSLRNQTPIIPKYLPPSDNIDSAALLSVPVRNRIFFQEDTMREILISGCQDSEYSYDTLIGGSFTGSFTYHATKIIRETPQITYNQFYEKLIKCLPNDETPQTPQLEGTEENKNKILFS